MKCSTFVVNDTSIFFSSDVNFQDPLVIAERKKYYNRRSLFSWGFPLVVVAFCLTLQLTNTANVYYGKFTKIISWETNYSLILARNFSVNL